MKLKVKAQDIIAVRERVAGEYARFYGPSQYTPPSLRCATNTEMAMLRSLRNVILALDDLCTPPRTSEAP